MRLPTASSPFQSQSLKPSPRVRRTSPTTEDREAEGHWASGCLPEDGQPDNSTAPRDRAAGAPASTAARDCETDAPAIASDGAGESGVEKGGERELAARTFSVCPP